MKDRTAKGDAKQVRRVAIFDLDGTLFQNTFLSSILQLLSQKMYRLSLKLQKPNRDLVSRTRSYDEVVILTSRSKEELLYSTLGQLKENGVRYHRLIMFPSTRAKMSWKKRMVRRVTPTDWYDDLKEKILRADEKSVADD